MGKIFALIGPSGVGKTTIADNLDLDPIVSVTTREARAGEQHGRDYYFISKEKYFKLLQAEELAENVENYGNFYGITKKSLDRALASSRDSYLILTYEGLEILNEYLPEDAMISIFIYAPIEVIEHRLEMRYREGNITRESLNRRLNEYHHELSTASYCDFIVPSMTNYLDEAIAQVNLIITTCNQ